MLPRITIGPDISRPSIRSATSSRPTTSNELSRKKPVRTNALAPARPHAAASRQSGGSVAPSRRSLEGVRAIDTSLQDLAASSSLFDSSNSSSDASPAHSDVAAAAASAATSPRHHSPGSLQQAAAAGTASSGSSSAASLRQAASAASLRSASEADLAALLGGSSDAAPPPGATVISFGSIPMFVPVAYVDVPAAAVADAAGLAAPAAASATASQGDADEPGTPAGAAEGEAATTSNSSNAQSNLDAGSAEFHPSAYLAAAAAATALAAASASSGASSRNPSSQQLASGEGEEAAPTASDDHDELQQQQQAHPQAAEAAAAAAAAAAAWQQQQLYWQHHHHMAWQQQHWQQQQQWQHPMQQVPAAPPVFFYPMAYPYMSLPHMQYQQQQQQQEQYFQQQQQYYPHQQQQQMLASDASEQHCDAPAAADTSVPASPCASSMVSFDPTSGAGWPGSAGVEAVGSYHYDDWRGSSASSVASGYSSYRHHHTGSGSSTSGSSARQQTPRDVSTVTVTPVSSVKDAAGALAKVVSRHGSGVLLALSRVGDQAAQVTHVAAKSLAVARFYVNSRMSAEGAAGVGAAAALTGVEPPSPAASLAAAVEDELVFMPYFRAGSGSSSGPEPAISFLVAKAAASELPSQLPPPVGVPSCMADQQQQQPAGASASISSGATATTTTGRGPLLRAGMSTDVNKLSNAIIHNVLASGHVGLQLAGAAACQIAMKALIKASSRLQRKFAEHIVATASFANVDTNSSIGRATVFLRVDVMRSSLLQQLAEGGREVGEQMGRQVAEALAAVVEGSRPQQVQPAGAF